MPPDYHMRAEQFGFASPNDIKDALNAADTQVLDVRNTDEIAAAGRFDHVNYKQTNGCTPSECPALSAAPQDFCPDKEATVVIYCRSGRRANAAKDILIGQGYSRVLNAGGYDDVIATMA